MHKRVDRDLLDAEDDGRFADVLLNMSSAVDIGLDGIRSPIRGLNKHFDAATNKLADMSGTERGSTLPDRCVFASDGDAAHVRERRVPMRHSRAR